MPQIKNEFKHIGLPIKTGVIGLSIAGDKDAIGHDFTDAVVAIEPCGQDVYEIWLHTNEGFSVRINANNKTLLSLSCAITAAVEWDSYHG